MARRKLNPIFPCSCKDKECADHFYPINGHSVKYGCLGITNLDGGMCDQCREYQLALVTVNQQ